MSNQTSTQINTPEDTTVTVGDQTQIAPVSQDDGGIHAASFVTLDQIIREGQRAFRKVGPAFERIKSEKLWDDFATGWTAYCGSHGCSPTHANRLIQAARADKVIRNALQNRSDSEYPQNAWQIRYLVAKLSDSEIVKSWNLALENAEDRKPLQKDVQAAVKHILGEKAIEKPEKKPNKKAEILARIERLHDLIVKREQSREEVSFEKVEMAFNSLKAAV
jgi:hypothetical protein